MATIDGEQASPAAGGESAPLVRIMYAEQPLASYADGYGTGYADGYGDGQTAGYASGYADGFTDGQASVDPVPPTITIISPPAGSTIGPSTTIVFRYEDDNMTRRPLPMFKIKQTDGTFKYELVHDGEDFTADYSGTKTVISAQNPSIIEFSVTRKNGWTVPIVYEGVGQGGDALQLVPFGTDASGNEPI